MWDEFGLKYPPKLNRYNDQCMVNFSDQDTQGVRRSQSHSESEQNWFSEKKSPGFSSPYRLFVVCLWTCLLSWVQTIYDIACVNFFNALWTQDKIGESREKFHNFFVADSLGLHKIYEKLSRNSFFLKFHLRILTEFGTKRDKFEVKRISIHVGKNQTLSHTNEPSFHAWRWWIKNLLQILWHEFGLKYLPKLNRYNDECMVNFSGQDTQGVRRSQSQTESEQN